MDVVAIGALAVDYFAVVPKIPEAEEKTTAIDYQILPGGVAGNVLTQTALLGLNSGWIGKIGDDPTGEILLNEFEKDRIDASHAEIHQGKHSMFTWIMVDPRGNRSITMFPNVLAELTPQDIKEKHAGFIRSSRILQTEACLLPLNIMIEAMEIAKDAGVTTIFDLDVPPSEIKRSRMGTEEELKRILALTDVLVPCKAAATELLGTDDFVESAADLSRFGPKRGAVTLGADGCVVYHDRQVEVVPGFSVDVADTTGAGDAFHGGMIYAILEGLDPRQSGRIANACGATCCRKVGARSMGTLEEVSKLFS